MEKMAQRLKIKNESIERIDKIKKGDRVTNICAGDKGRHGTFIKSVVKTHKNRYGIEHKERWAKVRYDYGGKERNTCITVIHPGELSPERCKEAFSPVWESEHG